MATNQDRVCGIADVKIIDDMEEIRKADSVLGKPFLRITFENGTRVDMSLNLAEMIGAVATGAQKRFGFAPDNGPRRKTH